MPFVESIESLSHLSPFSVLFLQRAQSELAAHQKKILHVDNHIGISIAGLTADARLLWLVTATPFSFAANSLKVS